MTPEKIESSGAGRELPHPVPAGDGLSGTQPAPDILQNAMHDDEHRAQLTERYDQLRVIAKRDYLRLCATDRSLVEARAMLEAETAEVGRYAQLLADLRDEVIHAATNSTDRLARERLLAAVERAK